MAPPFPIRGLPRAGTSNPNGTHFCMYDVIARFLRTLDPTTEDLEHYKFGVNLFVDTVRKHGRDWLNDRSFLHALQALFSSPLVRGVHKLQFPRETRRVLLRGLIQVYSMDIVLEYSYTRFTSVISTCTVLELLYAIQSFQTDFDDDLIVQTLQLLRNMLRIEKYQEHLTTFYPEELFTTWWSEKGQAYPAIGEELEPLRRRLSELKEKKCL